MYVSIHREDTDTRITVHGPQQPLPLSLSLSAAFNEIAFNMQYTIMLTAHPPAGLCAPPAAKKQFFQQPSAAIAGTRDHARSSVR
mgnify:CR=1 FL=1